MSNVNGLNEYVGKNLTGANFWSLPGEEQKELLIYTLKKRIRRDLLEIIGKEKYNEFNLEDLSIQDLMNELIIHTPKHRRLDLVLPYVGVLLKVATNIQGTLIGLLMDNELESEFPDFIYKDEILVGVRYSSLTDSALLFSLVIDHISNNVNQLDIMKNNKV